MELTDQIYKMDNTAHGRAGPGLSEKLHPLTVDFITSRFLPSDDPVLNGYITKYKLGDPDTYTAIFDKDSTYFINSLVLAQMAERICMVKNITKINLTIIVTGTGRQRLHEDAFNPDKINLTVTPVLNWDLAVQLMSFSVNHILTRSKLSNICSKLPVIKQTDDEPSQRYILVPTPSIDGTQHETGFSIMVPMESTIFFDRIYYINLDKRTDRRKHIEEQFMRFNLGSTRVSAVDGATLEWQPENHGPMSTYWNKGALGYCLSYASAIADALQCNSNQVLILDDDAVLMPNMFEVLEKAYSTLPDDWHMLYLAANHGNAKPTEADRISDTVYRLKGSVGSHAIIVNRPAFETILNFASSPYGPLDVFLSVYQQICPCYITYPGLATQLSGYSDIINKDVDYTKAIDYINHI